jgi:hypothetical protein
MATVSSVILRSLNDATINIASLGACQCGGLVMCTKPAFARYHAVNFDFSTSRWLDTSGNNRHTVSSAGTIQRTSGLGNGATVSQTYIYGGTSSRITFPSGSLPPSFTLCIVDRYNGGTQGRIFVSPGNNMFHGHWSARRGTALWHSWMAYEGRTPGPNTDWLVFCGK